MAIDKSRIQALCFDVDGTLRDTDDQFVKRLVRIMQPVKKFFKDEDPTGFARRLVMALEDPANYLYGIPDRLHFDHHLDRIAEFLFRSGIGRNSGDLLLMNGAKEMLDELAARYPLAIVSARSMRGTMEFLEHFELSDYFQAIAASQTCQYTKPFPDPVLWAAQQIGVPPAACLMIGDTTVDIHAGKKAGAQTAGVLCGFGEKDELIYAGADVILAETADLVDFLR